MRSLRLALACAALLVSAAAGCGMIPHVLYGKRIAGQVVDADTGQPIAGAHVAYLWESTINPSGFTGHSARTICYHAAATVTDAQGRFEIPAWRKWSTYDVDDRDPNGLLYAPNYVPQQLVLFEGKIKPPVERVNERYLMKTFSGTAAERLDSIWAGIGNRGCMYGGDSQKSLYPIQKALYEEARSMAATDDQRRRVHFFALMAADAALAADPNGPSNGAEVEKFIREKLK